MRVVVRHPDKQLGLPCVLVVLLTGCLVDQGDDESWVDADVDEPAVAYADEVLELNTRLRNEYLATVSTASAGTYITSQRTDGSWADVDYSSQTSSTWPALTHLNRILAISVAYHRSGDALYHSTAAATASAAAVRKALTVPASSNHSIRPTR